MIEKLRAVLSNAYRYFGDSETDIQINVNEWINRLKSDEKIKIELTDGTQLEGIDIHVAMRVSTREELTEDQSAVDDKIESHSVSCVIMVTDNEPIIIKHEYGIANNDEGNAIYQNQQFQKAELEDFDGEFVTICP